MDRRIYKPKVGTIVFTATFLIGCVVVTFLALFAGGSFLDEQDPGQKYGRLVSAIIFGAISVAVVRTALLTLATFEVDDVGFSWRGSLGHMRYQWGDLVGYRQLTQADQGYTLLFTHRRSLIVRFSALQQGDQFKLWLDEYVVPYIGDWLHKPEPEQGEIVSHYAERFVLFGLALLIMPTLVVGVWFKVLENDRNDVFVLPVLAATALSVVAVARGLAKKTVVTGDFVILKDLFRSWSVRLEDIWEVHLSSVVKRSTSYERIQLVTMEKVYLLFSSESEYTRLRNAVIERAPLATVVDSRLAKDRTYLPRVDYVLKESEVDST